VRREPADDENRPWSHARYALLLGFAARVLLPFALVVSLYAFLRGHNQPGGGFVAGLVTAVALVMQYMAAGRERTESRLRFDYVRLIGAGIGIAGLTGIAAWLFGKPFLTSAHGHPHVPLLGEIPLASAAVFDLGVYLTVVGATMLMISALGTSTRPPLEFTTEAQRTQRATEDGA
jgi:multicomponent K+:H+ antiporter subunit A